MGGGEGGGAGGEGESCEGSRGGEGNPDDLGRQDFATHDRDGCEAEEAQEQEGARRRGPGGRRVDHRRVQEQEEVRSDTFFGSDFGSTCRPSAKSARTFTDAPR